MDMGFVQGTDFTGFIIDINNEEKRIDVKIQAKTNAQEPQENLIAGKDFVIQRVSTQDVELVEENSKAQTIMQKIDYFMEDKRY